jgi:uncharacterized membrane protein
MNKGRLEAFSDGVMAIILTIMVLELKVPQGVEWSALCPIIPVLMSYVLSFVFIGIYWNNHHHMFQAVGKVNGHILWANLHLLFWLSLIPFFTRWLGENPDAAPPAALYGVDLLMSGIAYYILARILVAYQGKESKLAAALGKDYKGLASIIIYAAAIPLAFLNPRIAYAFYVLVALLWLIPDRRIEDRLTT